MCVCVFLLYIYTFLDFVYVYVSRCYNVSRCCKLVSLAHCAIYTMRESTCIEQEKV